MTDKQCISLYLEYLKTISQQGYSQDLMEMSSNMFVVIPNQQLEYAMNKFIGIAKQGLPEVDYHYEISKVFKELMGYPKTKT